MLSLKSGSIDHLIDHPGIITAFTVTIIAMLVLDLGVLNKSVIYFVENMIFL